MQNIHDITVEVGTNIIHISISFSKTSTGLWKDLMETLLKLLTVANMNNLGPTDPPYFFNQCDFNL